MRSPHRPPRLALMLLAHAARRWPTEVQEQSHRAWLAELHSLAADPDTSRGSRQWQALRFSLSLAVRRPGPSAGPLAPVITTPRSHRQLLGATIGIAIFGTLAAMLLVHLPGAVADRLRNHDSDDAIHQLPLLALVPVLVVIGVFAGRRLGRRDTLADVTRTVIVIGIGLCFALLLPMLSDIVLILPGLALWASGLWAAAQLTARLARRPRGPVPWMVLALAVLALIDLSVTSTVWLSIDVHLAPRAYALNWFPSALLEPAVVLPMGTDATGYPVDYIIMDFIEFLPHGLIITSAFALAYIDTTAAGDGRRQSVMSPAV